jgi:hypothetical protein
MPKMHYPIFFHRCTTCLAIFSAIVFLARPSVAAEPPLPSVRQVVLRLNDLFRVDSSEAELTMKVVTDRYRRELTLHSWTRGKEEALIVVRAPAREAGAATLRSKDGLWIYAPRADRLVRLPSALLSESWMGSHFTNEDLIRETDFARDYDTTLAWKEECSKRVLQATLVPKPKTPIVWSRVVYLLDPADFLPLRADFYDQNRISRTLAFSDPHMVSGRRVPFILQMVPTDKPGEQTHLEYRRLQFGVAVDPSLFTQRGLRQVARP